MSALTPTTVTELKAVRKKYEDEGFDGVIKLIDYIDRQRRRGFYITRIVAINVSMDVPLRHMKPSEIELLIDFELGTSDGSNQDLLCWLANIDLERLDIKYWIALDRTCFDIARHNNKRPEFIADFYPEYMEIETPNGYN